MKAKSKLRTCGRQWRRAGKPGKWLGYMKKCMKTGRQAKKKK